MTEAQAATSLAQHARLFDAGAHVVAAAFVDGAPALALADGVVLIGEPDEQKRVVAHPEAAMLTAVGDGKTLLTGGDDGRVVAVRADGEPKRSPTRRAAGSTRWRFAERPARGAPASRSARATKPERSSPGARRRRLAGSPSSPRVFASRRPITTARRSGFRRSKASRKPWNGRARISTPPSLPTAAFSSPRCRRTRCTAGGFPIRATCA